MKKGKTNPVKIKVQSGNEEAIKEAHIYVFSKEGKLIESKPLKGGIATLEKVNAQDIEGKTHILIGPDLPKGVKREKLNPIKMKKMGAYQPPIHLDKDNSINIIGIANLPFPSWDWCLITGNVTKTFDIDGQDKVLPICDARVHICEVDRISWWWPRIPVNIIDELAKKIREVIINPIPPFPPHEPGDPGPLHTLSKQRYVDVNEKTVKKDISAPRETVLSQLPMHVQNGLLSTSKIVVRDTIYDNFHLFHPYLCLWPWFWPYFYFCDEIATVYTDCNGRFSYEYFNPTNDKDIYVWVEVCINGQWVTVYRPPLPCNTRWNYSCGSDINIQITDPRVMPCYCGQQLQGEIVWFRSVGEYATALHIEQDDSNTVNVQGINLHNVGCTDVTDSHRISPFGSTLNFKLLFGDGLPSAGITHYRWRKTKIKDAALNDIWFPETSVVNGMIQKTYFVITTDVNGDMHFETKAVTLGAEGADENVGYRIPHWDIYQDPGVPAADKLKTIQWTSPDFWSASIDSNSLTDGTWLFELELLKENAGVFTVVEVPKQVFQVSDYNNSGDSVNAPDAYLNIDGGNPSKAFNLKAKVRVDNIHCHADIQDANITVNGVTEYSGKCGFLHYTDVNQLVHISFIASHPRNFATFSFTVVKGNGTENPGIDQNGYVISSVGLYSLSGGIFSNDFPVLQLIGGCPQAAFAEHLYVTSLATNGTRRLEEYDASDLNAFALSNT